jgi:hypothetical protein
MAALQGLKGLVPDPQDTTDIMDEGVLEARSIGKLADDHGEYGSQNNGYSGTVPPASPFSGMAVYDGYDYDDANEYGALGFRAQGMPQDMTPETHSSPYPRGIIQPSWGNPDAYAGVGEQMQQLHGTSLGASEFYNEHAPAGHETPTNYTTNDYAAPNENILSTVDGQLRGGWPNGGNGHGAGNADTTQGYGVLNTMDEFNRGHSIRREQHDNMPMDWTATHGEQDVPFYGRHPVEQMPLDGPDSPYFDNGSIDGGQVVWEGRIGEPTQYEQPPEPAISRAALSAPDTYAWG